MFRSLAIALMISFTASTESSASASDCVEVSFPLAQVSGGLQHARFWQASDEKAVLLCLHGIQTHSGWFQPLAEKLVSDGVSTYALDRRGSGAWSVTASHPQYLHHAKARGDVLQWQSWVDDIRLAAQGIQKRHPDSPLYLLGVSWGAKTALGALVDHKGKSLFRGAIFIAPAFVTEIDPNFVMSAGQKIMATVAQDKTVNIGQKIGLQRYSLCPATHERWLKHDPVLLNHVTHRFISQSQQQFRYAIQHLTSVSVPILSLYGTADSLVNVYASEQKFLPLRQDPPPLFGGAKLTTFILKDLTHASIVEAPERLAAQIIPWVHAHRKQTPPLKSLILPAYATGYPLKNGIVTALKSDLIGKAHGLDTGLDVIKGQKITLCWDTDVWWQDASLTACTPGGCLKEVLIQKIARFTLILRRTKDNMPAPYLTLLTHVKRADGSAITVEAGFKKGEERPEIIWIAPATGRLYLSANDATFFQPRVIFTNNTGSLKIEIRQ